MGRIEDRLADTGLALPRPMAAPPGIEIAFDLVRRSRGYAFTAGHGPADGDQILMQGKVGDDLTTQQGYDAARLAALSTLASLKQALGDLDSIANWVRVVGYVNATPGFAESTVVGNGFSHLIKELWGDAGRHTRAVPAVAGLPLNMPVVFEALVELDERG